MKIPIAFFITSHGFGHAARACAVMSAIRLLEPTVFFEIFSAAPRWFFDESLPQGSFTIHDCEVDVGLVQTNPMSEDLPATLNKIKQFIPFPSSLLDKLVASIKKLGCRLAICDISPLGIAVAGKAGIPSALVENFTWDWIYQAYLSEYPGFEPYIRILDEIFCSATIRIQTMPVCMPVEFAALTTYPVYREPLNRPEVIRQKLGISDGSRMVLVTMGGIPEKFSFLDMQPGREDIILVIPGGSNEIKRIGNMLLLPHHSSFYHPDLMYAADAVVGKSGYSTIAEAYRAGIPFGYISRARFRESIPLAAYISREIKGFEINQSEFNDGSWVKRLDALLSCGRIQRSVPNGANQIAELMLNILKDAR